MKPLCSLKVGQKVRIPVNKGIFAKGYEIGWTDDIYEIINVEMVIFHDLCLVRNTHLSTLCLLSVKCVKLLFI